MAKHIIKAREFGAQVGLDALIEYLGSPLGSTNPHMDEVREELDGLKTKAQRLNWYCGRFSVEKKPNGATVVAKTQRTRRKATTTTGSLISAGQAWEALGSDPKFEPNDPERPAYGMLNVLNHQGRLVIIDA